MGVNLGVWIALQQEMITHANHFQTLKAKSDKKRPTKSRNSCE